jgi:2',3'-cyclic-nucleotide 2'-phosphodiesterase (5'-nucleotidase family)
MKRIVSLLLFISLLPTSVIWAQEQNIRFKFYTVQIDSTFDAASPTKASLLMNYYRPEMERRMMTVVGYAPHEMRSFRPESPLSNFAADALLTIAQQHSKAPVDFSITNFGGLRASFPQGDVKLYDVFAVFPFENMLVILELEGKDVWELFANFARRNSMEAVGNVRAEVENRTIRQLTIAGQPFDMNRRYRVATIDFLLGGGDSVLALKNAVSVTDTDVTIRDAVVQYISILKNEGREISASIDGRIKGLENK